jgi:hypothetical protein
MFPRLNELRPLWAGGVARFWPKFYFPPYLCFALVSEFSSAVCNQGDQFGRIFPNGLRIVYVR